jgi:VanZ family protein
MFLIRDLRTVSQRRKDSLGPGYPIPTISAGLAGEQGLLMRDSFEHSLMSYVRRHILEVLLALYALPLLWVGLVPFDYAVGPVSGTPHDTWWGLPVVATHLPDNLANIALFIPLGLLTRLILIRRRRGVVMSVTGTILLAGVMSYAIEQAQIYSASRISSAADFGYNLIGAIVGALASSMVLLVADTIHALGRRARDRLAEAIINRPSAVLAQICAVFLFLAAVAPFDITFSANRLYESLRAARLTPFAADTRLSHAVYAGSPADPAYQAELAARDRWQLHLDYAWTFAGYLVLGVLIARYLRRHCNVQGVRRAAWTVCAGLLLAVAGTAAQIFIISRVIDVTEVVLALAGISIGLMLSETFVTVWQGNASRRGSSPQRRSRVLAGMLVVCAAYTAARELAPFVPDTSAASIRGQLGNSEWMPFSTYQRAKLPMAIDDLLGKLARFGAIGCLWAALQACRGTSRRRYEAMAMGAIAAAAVSILECAQVLLPSRFPSITDVLIGFCGAAAGVVAMRLATVLVNELSTPRAGEIEPVRYDVTFGDAFPAPIESAPMSPSLRGRRGTGEEP